MNLFSVSRTCKALCLAAILTGCGQQQVDPSAVEAIKNKNDELTAQIEEMEATILQAKQLDMTAEQIMEKQVAATEQYNQVVQQLVSAIDRNIQVSGEYGTLKLREQELEDRLRKLGDTFHQMQEEASH